MNTFYKIISAAGIALAVMISPVNASTIFGEISFAGGFTPTGGTAGNPLKTATGINFTGDQFQVTLDGVSGDFAAEGISAGDTGTINDFVFNPFPVGGVNPLWAIGGFEFDLASVSILEQTSTSLILSGKGSVSHDDYTDTEGTWYLTGNTIIGTNFSWSSTTASVPETLTLTLFGIGLLGLGGVIRRKKIQMS